MSLRKPALLAMGCSLLGACGDDAQAGGTGTLEVTSYGEAFIEEGIPASAVGDGWALTFTSFEVTIRDIVVGDLKFDDPQVVDLVQGSDGGGHTIGSMEVPSGSYGQGSFTISALHVVGSAKKGEESRSFDWAFDVPVHYHDCETTTKVPKDGAGVFQITVHADHLFYDSLVSEEPAVGFQAFADADSGDGVISQAELEATGIGGFDPGNEDIDDLWGWLRGLVATVGHVDGEGHCHAEPVE